MSELSEFYAVCPAGFEPLVADELKNLKVKRIRPLKGGVAFFGTIEDGMRACLWFRCASRVLMIVERVGATNAEALYDSVRRLPWEEYLAPDSTIAVAARGTNANLKNTQFTAVKVKDAICDALRERCGWRPQVRKHRPDVAIDVSLHAQKATIALDMAGEPLHQRGYRLEGETVEAPLKETLAAGMLFVSPWANLVERLHAGDIDPDQVILFDPFCGSGTLVIEAAMMAADMAPGIHRGYWGFAGWKTFDRVTFDRLLQEADQRLEEGLARMPHLIASDKDQRAIDIALQQARRFGLARYLQLTCADCADVGHTLEDFDAARIQQGCVVGNPPYGVRLMVNDLDIFYGALQKGLEQLPKTWTFTAITPDPFFDDQVGASPISEKAVYNGAIETSIRTYDLGHIERRSISQVTLSGRDVIIPVLSDHPEQFAARLRKNAKLRRKWAKDKKVFAQRLYDADLPDYAVAIDLFMVCEEVDGAPANRTFDRPYLVISEYQAPRSIDAKKAHRRFEDTVRISTSLLEIPRENVFARVRKQERGGKQYAFKAKKAKRVLTQESGLVFELDLASYLDVGLFLDHRITRQLVAASSRDRDVLNLFAYTGSASVYAAAGGAKSVTTVDLSQTYLDWARRNMAANGFSGSSYRFVRADARQWVREQADRRNSRNGNTHRYDLVFVDPPTFSNSKAMGRRTWDIQRDHPYLLRDIARLLKRGGMIIFSGNLRSFKLDVEAIEEQGFNVRDITAKTIPDDFARNPKIHFCFALQLRS